MHTNRTRSLSSRAASFLCDRRIEPSYPNFMGISRYFKDVFGMHWSQLLSIMLSKEITLNKEKYHEHIIREHFRFS